MAHELAAFLVPLGIIGAAVAVLCAVIAGIAIARGAGGLAGGAVGLWIPATVLSLTASFAHEWTPLIVAGAALVGMLVVGTVLRVIIGSAEARAALRPATAAAEITPISTASGAVPSAVSTATSSTPATVTPRAVASTSTGSVPALAS
jgi:hypothetical protein